jgi:PiT family inorganic phosphate transporter
MFIAFVISLWFLLSFRKDFLPRIVSTVIMALVIYILYNNMVFDKAELAKGTHYKSYIWQVIFYTKNFKWILLGLILTVFAIFTFWLNTLNAHKSNIWFKRLQLISSAAFSIGHGGNDAQKVMGIIMAALVASDPATYHLDHMVWWVPIACYSAIGLGTMSGGWRIIKTMGTRITKVTPFEGVAAETAGAITLFVTEALKIPVSTTHTITGSIMGVGATKRLSAVRWGVTINLLWAWILTIPISALLAAGIFSIARLF